MKVLFLSAWYPTEKDQMAGLFVKKHVEAVRALGVDARVYHYEKIPKGWRPDLIQLNVLSLKNAIKTYFLHLWYGVPYVLVEHWSRYLPQNNTFPKGIEGAVLRFVAKRASMIMPVSQALMSAMQACGIRNKHWQLIYNVVDDFFYAQPAQPVKPVQPAKPAQPAQLLHVSCFDEKSKNVKGILRAMEQLYKQRQDWHLTIVGTGRDFAQVFAYAKTLVLPESHLTWTGELSPKQVCQYMQQSDLFVLFSNYETYGIVLTEAIAAGLPVISSYVGIAPEIITQKNGILVPAGDETALVDAICEVLNNTERYDREKIRCHGQQYSFTQVGKQLMNIYSAQINRAAGI